MTYTYIVNPETGEILFDLVHDLITQNIRAIKLIAKKLNAVLRQKRGNMHHTPKYSRKRQKKRQSQKLVTAINSKTMIQQIIIKVNRELAHQAYEAICDIRLKHLLK